MTQKIYLVHPNGKQRVVKGKFCWTAFLIPQLWAISEGLWRPFAFTLLCSLVLVISGDATQAYQNQTFIALGFIQYLLLMIVFGVYGKKWLVKNLIHSGYVDNSSLHTDASRQ